MTRSRYYYVVFSLGITSVRTHAPGKKPMMHVGSHDQSLMIRLSINRHQQLTALEVTCHEMPPSFETLLIDRMGRSIIRGEQFNNICLLFLFLHTRCTIMFLHISTRAWGGFVFLLLYYLS